jgi:hypothetical protein
MAIKFFVGVYSKSGEYSQSSLMGNANERALDNGGVLYFRRLPPQKPGGTYPTMKQILKALRANQSKSIKATSATGGAPQKLNVACEFRWKEEPESSLTDTATNVVISTAVSTAFSFIIGPAAAVVQPLASFGYGAYQNWYEAYETPLDLNITTLPVDPLFTLANNHYTFGQLADELESSFWSASAKVAAKKSAYGTAKDVAKGKAIGTAFGAWGFSELVEKLGGGEMMEEFLQNAVSEWC